MTDLLCQTQLENLLNKDVNAVIESVRSTYDELIDTSHPSFILFGAGRLGRVALAGLRRAGIEPIAFTDNNPKLWSKDIDALQVLSPTEAILKFGGTATFVVTVYTSEPVRKQLKNLNAKVISFAALSWAFPETLLPHATLELPHKIFDQADEVRKALLLWEDDLSRQEYLAQIKWRTSLDTEELPPHLPPDQIYFPEDIVSFSPHEVFVDCGAFDGDTVREFLKSHGSSFDRVFALEPDPANFQRLESCLSTFPYEIRNKAAALQVAVGSRHEKIRFEATGTAASALGSGTHEVQCSPIDEILSDHSPTYIKMDVEGAELDALIGTRRTMENRLPILAICLYHRQEDLWQIPLFIRSVSSKYRLFLRRYADECWELVCYAVPVGRLVKYTQKGYEEK